MCDVYREMWFSKEMFLNGLNMGLPWETWVEKTVHEEQTHWLSNLRKRSGCSSQ